MVHALQLKSGGSFNHGMYHYGNIRSDLGFDLLLKAREYSNAEKILKQCIEARKTPDWAGTPYIENDLLAELNLEEGKYDEAKKWAEALLATCSDSNGICHSKGGSARGYLFFDTVDKFTAKKQFTLAQHLLDNATKVLLTVTGPRNTLFIEAYQAQARLLEAQGKLSTAEGFARKALDLENWIGGSANSGRVSTVLLASILRKEGKTKEADTISVTQPKLENRSQDFAKLYNQKFFTTHSPLPELYADTAQDPLKQALSQAIDVHGEGSSAAHQALDNLTRFYMQKNRYDQAEKLQQHQLQILNDQYGKCSEPKFGCFLYLAEIYVLENKLDKASKFVEQITEPPLEIDRSDPSKSQLRMACVLLSVGKRDQALMLGQKVEADLLSKKRRFGFGFIDIDQRISDCLHFMEKAGAVEDTNALRRLQNSIDEQRHRPPSKPAMLPIGK